MHRHHGILAAAILLGLTLPGCWPWRTPDKHSGLVVVNVLDKPLYEDCRIAGSINVPLDEVDLIEGLVAKDAEVIVYCSNYLCTASSFARNRMRTIGFANVRAYEPGTAAWYQAGLPVEGPCKEGYLKQPTKPAADQEEGEDTISTQELADKLGVKPSTPVNGKE